MQITPAAAERIKTQLSERGQGLGLRVGLKKAGCSGWMYTIDYADEISDQDEVVETDGAKVVMTAEDADLLNDVIMDFRQEGLNRMFRFENPKATGSCGCGESFTLE